MLDQVAQDVEYLRLEGHRLAVGAQLLRLRVELEV